MRRALAFAVFAFALFAAAPGQAQDVTQADENPPPSFPLPRVRDVARAAAASPLNADQVVAAAIARNPSQAADIEAAAISALPVGRNFDDIAARIAAAAGSTAPQYAPDVTGAAVGAAARTAAKSVRIRPDMDPGQAVQATLTASATAAAQVTQAIIVGIAQLPDTPVTASVAAAITRRAVEATMRATSAAATEAAQKAGAAPDEAAMLAAQAARLSATTVTQSAIAAATAAVQAAAQNDGEAARERVTAPPQTVAETSAAAASTVADSVTRAAVSASVAEDPAAPVATASAVTDAAAASSSTAVSSAASDAAAAAGASPDETQRIAQAAGVQAEQRVSRAAAEATVTSVPNVSRSKGAAAAGPALAGGIDGLKRARERSADASGNGGEASAASRTELVTREAAALTAPSATRPIPQGAGGATGTHAAGDGSVLSNPALLLPYLIAILAVVVVLGLALPWLEPDIFASRLKSLAAKRSELSQQRRQRLEAERPQFRRMVSQRQNFMRTVLEKLNVKNLTEQPELRKKLIRAGYRSVQAVITFTFLRLALPLGLGAFSALLLFGGNAKIAGILKLLSCLGAMLVGYLLPSIMVKNAITKRQADIQKKFPDALDLMVICVESGISLEAAFTRISDEMALDAPTLSEEIAITSAELAFLSDRRQALENLSDRAATPGIKSLVTALIQSEKYGTPLAAALRVVAQESRDTRMAKAEEKAAALPAKLTVPMVTFFLPVLFMVLIGPTIIQVMHAFSHGG
jgi:tight adherence protein C